MEVVGIGSGNETSVQGFVVANRATLPCTCMLINYISFLPCHVALNSFLFNDYIFAEGAHFASFTTILSTPLIIMHILYM